MMLREHDVPRKTRMTVHDVAGGRTGPYIWRGRNIYLVRFHRGREFLSDSADGLSPETLSYAEQLNSIGPLFLERYDISDRKPCTPWRSSICFCAVIFSVGTNERLLSRKGCYYPFEFSSGSISYDDSLPDLENFGHHVQHTEIAQAKCDAHAGHG
jgi:hypothetical protein